MMGLNPYMRAVVKPIFDLFKSMPPLAWISLAILWFGIMEAPKIFIIVIGSFVPALLNAYNGVLLIEPEYYDVVRNIGGKRRDEIFTVCVPAALPAVYAGLQIAMSSAWTCVLAAELVSSRSGLGFIIIQGMTMSDPSLVIAGMIIIAILSVIVSALMDYAYHKLFPWQRDISKV
jgi:ABC-type nitrate/sulfonate/bicarbonate transport system permease component